LRLAGPAEPYEKVVVEFSRHLGVAFQILNDLKDWQPDEDNKLGTGLDVMAGRPTLLLALALEGSKPATREELLTILQHASVARANGQTKPQPIVLERVRRLFTESQAFVKAEAMVDKFRARAEAVADDVQPEELRELLYYLIDSVLDRLQSLPEAVPQQLVQLAV
jgi:geranylgeranyl pyrophosphate synthase